MKRFWSMALAVLMIISLLPMSVFAAELDDLLSVANFTVIENDRSTLAPGVSMNELVLYNSSNQRVEMYITTVDTAVDTVKVMANYMDNQNSKFGMQTLSDQVAAMEANYPEPFKIVAGINASYYNTTTGQPTGAFVMEGVDASASGDNYAFFAVLKDGTYMIGAKGEYSTYKDQLQEAIGGYHHIVIDGAVASGLDKKTLYPRQTLGLTADGKLILMTADGSQAPATVGLTIQEQAEVMLALGCVEAIHLDGGNSATFGAIREGTDKFVTVNSPSGGGERAVSNTLMIISTAVSSGTFDHAVITAEYEYYAPYSQYTFSAFGVDATNSAAEIPDTAVWTLSDDSFGTISNGTFVSNGKSGTVNIQLTVNDTVVGSKAITITDPTSVSFDMAEATVPYGKTAQLNLEALYGNYPVHIMADQFDWTVSPAAAGSMNGFHFTAGNNEEIAKATITATYKYDNGVEAASIATKFGKGSEVIFDFEDGDISDWKGVSEIPEWINDFNAAHPNAKYPLYDPKDYGNSTFPHTSYTFLSTEENGGKVKSGQYALGVKLDRLNADGVGSWIYNYLYYTGETQIWRDVANGKGAIRLGMWVNMPQNGTNTAFRICRTFTKDSSGKLYANYDYMNSDYDGKRVSYNTDYAIPESGWIYVYFDLSAYDFQSSMQFSETESYAVNNGKGTNGDYFPAFIQFINGDKNDTMEEVVLYIDDITLDYSEVTDDRDAPAISDMTVCSDTANFVPLNGQTVTNNLLSFSANVTDVSGNSNTTGLNYASAKIYVDGIDLSEKNSFKASAGLITLNDIYITNGAHKITFAICDNAGNETRVTKDLTVNGSAENALVTITGHNDGNYTPKAGSVYYIDVTASDAAQINAITTTLKLNTANTFEYDHIVCAEGVKVQATKDPICNELTLEITHDGSLSGEATLVSVPVRVWAWDEEETGIKASTQFASGAIPVINIECETTYGAVTYVDGTYDTYACAFFGKLNVATELDNKTVWHEHTAVALKDLSATCTKDGYTDRTYCDGCASVLDWGTTVAAQTHSYEAVGGELVCHCGEKYIANGLVQTDNGLYYILGGNLVSGWNYVDTKDAATTGYYYFSTLDYKAVNGDHVIDGYAYKFENNLLVRGTLEKTDSMIRYKWAGEWVMNSWATIDGEKYYFTSNGAAKIGPGTIRGENGVFAFNEDGIWLEGRTGLMDVYGRVYYYNNGMCKAAGLVKVDEDYYYINPNYQPVTGKYWVGKPNTDVTGLAEGEYEFADDGKMIGKVVKNGPVGDYFYVNDVVQKAYRLVEHEGYYYFINSGNKLAKNCVLYMTEEFTADHGIPAGNYTFDEQGRIVLKNGPVGDYFYLNNVMQRAYQLVEFEGNYYFINDGNKLAKNCKIYLGEQFTAKYDLPAGYYNFDEDGKVVFRNGIIGDYYYINDVVQKAYQLVEIEGYYYFINSGNKLAKSCVLYMTEEFTAEHGIPAGYYNFDEYGRIELKNGPVGDYFYLNNVMQRAYQLVEFGGNYYFINDGSKLAKNCKIYLGEQFTSKYDLPAGYYTFDEDGKVVFRNGIIGDYYYINDVLQKAYQLVEIEGDYYFINDGNKLAKNCRIYLGQQFTSKYDLPVGYYTFDEDGKAIFRNGIVGDYYYANNVMQKAYQLVEFEGNYYFINNGNKIAKNCKLYLLESYLHKYGLPAGDYNFDAEGKMILKNGPVDGKFYIQGICQNPYQLLEFEGNYYFVNDGGFIAKNCKIYLSKEFVYAAGLPVGYYTFDSAGRMIIE